MAARKTVGKAAAAVSPKKAPAAKVKEKPAGPTARACPLVLDGEVNAADFSEKDCLSCGEFDCRFCESQGGSGALRSRLFAATDDSVEDDGEDWGSDFDAEGDGEEDEGDEEGDDLI